MAIIDEISPLKGSQQVYSADELIDVIKQVKNGTLDSTYITSTAGLRQKVSELIFAQGAKNEKVKTLESPYKVEGHDWLIFYDKVYENKTLHFIFSNLFLDQNQNGNRVGRRFSHEQLGNFLDQVAPTRERFFNSIKEYYDGLIQELANLHATETVGGFEKAGKTFEIQRLQEKMERFQSLTKNPNDLYEAVEVIYGKK